MRRLQSLPKGEEGFSLVELMIVVAIIGILAGLAVPKFNLFQAKARQAEVKSNLSHIYTLQQSHFGDEDSYVEFAAISATSCTNDGAKKLGFTPSPCAKLRYAYSSTIAGTASFTATGEAPLKKIYPGCKSAANDTWTIDEQRNLSPPPPTGGLAACSGN